MPVPESWPPSRRRPIRKSHPPSGSSTAGSRDLASLLAAAAAPATSAEYAGENAAVRAYRAARTVGPARAPVSRRTPPGARLSAWAVAVAVAGTAGAAVAAGAGNLEPAPRSVDGAGPAPATPSVSVATPHPAPTPVAASPRTPVSASATERATASERATGSAALYGHCMSYLARGGKPEKSLSGKPLPDLAEAAGGVDRIPTFCADLVADDTRGPKESKKAKKSPGNDESHKPD